MHSLSRLYTALQVLTDMLPQLHACLQVYVTEHGYRDYKDSGIRHDHTLYNCILVYVL
jgi:hypothetical protein